MARSIFSALGISSFGLAAAALLQPAGAATVYTSSTAFAAAATGLSVEDYSAYTAGTLLSDGSTLGALTYSFNTASGLGGVITNLYNSISGESLSAKQDPGSLSSSDFFFPTESFTVTFPTAVTAVGIFANINLPDQLSLSIAGTTATNNVALYDTKTFGFIGITSFTPFTSATFTSLDYPGTASTSGYNIAEIEFGKVSPVPLPAALPLLGTALTGLGMIGVRVKRRAKADATA